MRRLWTVLGTSLFAGMAASLSSAAINPEPSGDLAPGHRVVFHYHSNFLLNLHHFLFDAATHDEKLANEAWSQPPNAAEMEELRDSVALYRTDYAERNLLFDQELSDIKEKLSADDTSRSVAELDLPPPLKDALERAAPIYARCLWTAQNSINRDWIDRVQVLDASYGSEIQAEIEHYLAHPFVTEPVRVDVVVETGDRNGAYTTADPPHSVLPSGRVDYQGLAALEMLYHESSHAHVTDTMRAAIDAELAASHRPGRLALWHAVQFYTVGAVVQSVLKRRGDLDYQPYADRNGVYHGSWSGFRELIDAYWRPYMQGDLDMATAITDMVAHLPTP